MSKFGLGDTVRDKITGWKGVVIGRTEWINGCWRYTLQSTKLTKEGQMIDPVAVDELQLELVKAGTLQHESRRTGGPRRDPQPISSPAERR